MFGLRKMTWVLLIWTALCAIWLIAGVAGVDECPPGDTACEAGTAIGAGIGIVLIFFVWFIGFIIASIIWFMTKPKG